MTSRRSVVVGAGLIVALVVVVAVVVTLVSQPPRRTETGVVIAVDASSLTNVKGFTIRTRDGRTVVFRIGQLENGVQFPPGHLSEHMATAVPVVVTYRDENGQRVAIHLDDAVAASATSAAPASP